VLTRRQVLQAGAAVTGASFGFSGYAIAEPRQLVVRTYRITPPNWPQGFNLRIALVADLHVCDPWMNVARIQRIVERTNALQPDCTLLLGDYLPGRRMLRFARPIADREWAEALARLHAPLGVHAVLGNHDWTDDVEAQARGGGPTHARLALEAAGIPVYENDAVRLNKDGQPFWIAGLGDQGALVRWHPVHGWVAYGVHVLPSTLAKITDDAPVIMMAHEPDIFPRMPARVSLTVSGHTHGGQMKLPGMARFIPSRYGDRYRYGHIVERGRHLVVSGGLGCSGLPMRFGVPPEIVMVELGTWSSPVHSMTAGSGGTAEA
jgi:uncharacterized protein